MNHSVLASSGYHPPKRQMGQNTSTERTRRISLQGRERETKQKLATEIAKRVCCPSQHFADLLILLCTLTCTALTWIDFQRLALGQSPLPTKPTKKNKPTKPLADQDAEDGPMKRIFVFTNNSNQVDSVVDRHDFREMIQFAIDNGKHLQGYKHISRDCHAPIQFVP